MEQVQNKEQYARTLIKKAQDAVKAIKCLVIAAGALAGVLLIFGIIAITVIKDSSSSLIGFIVIISVIGVIFIALVALFIYAKVNLNKLKKLN